VANAQGRQDDGQIGSGGNRKAKGRHERKGPIDFLTFAPLLPKGERHGRISPPRFHSEVSAEAGKTPTRLHLST